MPDYKCFQVKDNDMIRRHWHGLSGAILASLPPTAYPDIAVSNNILEEIIRGGVQLWVLTHNGDGKTNVTAVGTTVISVDGPSKIRNLILYSLYGYERPPESAWRTAMEAMKAFAKENKCAAVLAFTNSTRVLDLADKLGMRRDTTVLRAEV